MHFTATVTNSPLSGYGYFGYPPGSAVQGMRERGITRHWGGCAVFNSWHAQRSWALICVSQSLELQYACAVATQGKPQTISAAAALPTFR